MLKVNMERLLIRRARVSRVIDVTTVIIDTTLQMAQQEIKVKWLPSKFAFNKPAIRFIVCSLSLSWRQLIGQRSSSVLGGEEQQKVSPNPQGEGAGEYTARHRHRHHGHHQAGERRSSRQGHQSRRTQAQQSNSSVGADGYGHINSELIFIERGEHSPHRQEPPPGYEYKGKIEVQDVERESRSRSRGANAYVAPQPTSIPQQALPQQQVLAQQQGLGSCPPGWQQMILTSTPGVQCPMGGAMFSAQVVGAASMPHAGLGGMSGFNGSSGGMGYGGGSYSKLTF